jgi:hypothetical protein
MPRANPLLSKEGEPRSGGVVCSKPRSVVEQPRIETLHRDDGRPQIFIRAEDYTSRPEHFAIQTDGDPRLLMSQIQPLIRRIDRRVAVSEVHTIEDIAAEMRSQQRISAVMIAGLAAGALASCGDGLSASSPDRLPVAAVNWRCGWRSVQLMAAFSGSLSERAPG